MTRRIPFILIGLVGLLLLSAPAFGQKLGRGKYEDKDLGFQLKTLKDWSFTPLDDRKVAGGLVLKMSADKALNVKVAGNQIMQFNFGMQAYRLDQPEATTGGESTGGLRNRVNKETKRPTVEELIPKWYSDLRDFKEYMDEPFDGPEEKKITKGLVARHVTYRAFHAEGFEILLDTWTFPTNDYDIAFVWIVAEDDAKKYLKAYEKSMKSFRLIEKKEEKMEKVAGDGDYGSFLSYTQEKAAKTPGWRVLEVPSKRFLLVTSSEDNRFLKDVTSRLEKSIDLYEKDFPPVIKTEFVSIVRVCGTHEEFMRYGDTSPNTAGYFNPGSKELVIYDNKERNRNETFAVMSHEAFHQYCHFLFNEAEAHRWFDEGQGDYYGCFDMDKRIPKVTAHMPGGLDRLPHIKSMLKADNYVPISRFIRMDHSQWYNNNSSYNGIASYAQSWSMVYFLRQGMRGKVPGKYWEKEYANIIPNYTKHLFAGYAETRAAVQSEIDEIIEKAGGENAIPPEDLKRLRNIRVDKEAKSKIWNKATAESWGKVDIEAFEENWKAFVSEDLR